MPKHMTRIIDTTALIEAVREHPELWEPGHSDFGCHGARLNAWHAVAIQCMGGDSWKRLRDSDKRLNVNMIQKRWKNIKDTYMKYSRKSDTYNMKKYVHADSLIFLTGVKSIRKFRRMVIETDAEGGSSRNTNESDQEGQEHSMDEETAGQIIEHEDNSFEKEIIQNYIIKNDSPDKAEYVDVNELENEEQNTMSISESLGDDPDKMFLLSMLPLFKKLDEENKITARIELTMVLQQLLYPDKKFL